MKFKNLIEASLLALLFGQPAQASDLEFKQPDIFVLGDSQMLFGSGPAFLDFFENIQSHCAPENASEIELKNFSVGVLGVRSTSLNSWVQRDDASKKRICTIDPNWHINASQFGTVKTTEKQFLQIGQEDPFRFCEPGKSAFETMFENQYYDPKLFVTYFLGNSANRWAASMQDAESDAIAAAQQIPADMPCLLMTTAPSYRKSMNEVRLQAQQNFKQAYESAGGKCAFIEGLTPDTIKANERNHLHFKHNKEEWVKDPFHPSPAGAEAFLKLKRADICKAVFEQFARKTFAKN